MQLNSVSSNPPQKTSWQGSNEWSSEIVQLNHDPNQKQSNHQNFHRFIRLILYLPQFE